MTLAQASDPAVRDAPYSWCNGVLPHDLGPYLSPAVKTWWGRQGWWWWDVAGCGVGGGWGRGVPPCPPPTRVCDLQHLYKALSTLC